MDTHTSSGKVSYMETLWRHCENRRESRPNENPAEWGGAANGAVSDGRLVKPGQSPVVATKLPQERRQ